MLPAGVRGSATTEESPGNRRRSSGVKVRVGVPEGANPDKVAAMRRPGAEWSGGARECAEERTRLDGYRYVMSIRPTSPASWRGQEA